jgi:Holliday junction DNA helicase RuvB
MSPLNKVTKTKDSLADPTVDQALRPSSWDEYVGQEKIKDNLKVIIEAARRRGEPVDHLLFYGQAGLGKTTLAHLVAREMGAGFKVTSGPALEKMGDIAAVLSTLEPGEILFIDEAHRLNHLIEEVLYPAMESRKLHLMVGKGPAARSVTLDLPPFTIVAATTRVNLLSGPLRSRFGGSFKLDYYELSDIKSILARSAKLLGVALAPAAVDILAKASRATPRVANRLLKRARDYAEVRGEGAITEEIARQALQFLEIDALGLEQVDRKLLSTIVERFRGGPVGLNAIAASLNEDRGTVEEVYEPYLMSIGFLERTPGGRVVTRSAYEHLGFAQEGRLM